MIAVILDPNLLIDTFIGEMQEMFTEGAYAPFAHINIRIPATIVPDDSRTILVRVAVDGVKLAIM